MCQAQIGGTHLGQTALSPERETIRSYILHMKMQWPMQNGRESGFPLKQSGNLQHAVVFQANLMCGVMSFVLMASGWPIHIRDIFRIQILVMMAIPELHLSRSFHRMAMVSMTWQGMSGNGPATGTGLIITLNWPEKAEQFEIPRALIPPTIPPNLAMRRRCIVADPFYAPINTVRATWLVHEAKAMLIQEPITLDFAVLGTSLDQAKTRCSTKIVKMSRPGHGDRESLLAQVACRPDRSEPFDKGISKVPGWKDRERPEHQRKEPVRWHAPDCERCG